MSRSVRKRDTRLIAINERERGRGVGQLGLFDSTPRRLETKTIQRDDNEPRAKRDEDRYLQNVLWEESILAVKLSLECESPNELASRLEQRLPQNSTTTRRRNANIIMSRFFPSQQMDEFPRRVLQAYGDESLLRAVMRVLFPEVEPLVGKLIAERLWPLPAGSELPKDFFVQYAQEISGKKEANTSYRCRTSARVLGWISVERNRCFVAHQAPDETTALLILHHHYASTPGVIDVKQLLSEPTWKYLAFSNEDAVRVFMRRLEQRGLISRYAVVDRLEQVTTRYSLESLLDRRTRV